MPFDKICPISQKAAHIVNSAHACALKPGVKSVTGEIRFDLEWHETACKNMYIALNIHPVCPGYSYFFFFQYCSA